MVVRDCKNCDFFDGFINIACSGCPVFHNAIKKSRDFRVEIKSKPTEEELNHFKQLWSAMD